MLLVLITKSKIKLSRYPIGLISDRSRNNKPVHIGVGNLNSPPKVCSWKTLHINYYNQFVRYICVQMPNVVPSGAAAEKRSTERTFLNIEFAYWWMISDDQRSSLCFILFIQGQATREKVYDSQRTRFCTLNFPKLQLQCVFLSNNKFMLF